MGIEKRINYDSVFPFSNKSSKILLCQLKSSFFSDYYKIFQSSTHKNQRDLKYNKDNSFFIKRNQDRKDAKKFTRKANIDYTIRDHAYEKKEHENELKGGYYSSYFTDLHNQESKRSRKSF